MALRDLAAKASAEGRRRRSRGTAAGRPGGWVLMTAYDHRQSVTDEGGKRAGMPVMLATSRRGPWPRKLSVKKSRLGRTQSTRRCRMDIGKSIVQSLTLLLLVLLGACSGPSTILPSVSSVRPAAIPALPPQARQQPAQPWCLPTCSSVLISERRTWLQMLIKARAGE